jgi:hypothetical protein
MWIHCTMLAGNVDTLYYVGLKCGYIELCWLEMWMHCTMLAGNVDTLYYVG